MMMLSGWKLNFFICIEWVIVLGVKKVVKWQRLDASSLIKAVSLCHQEEIQTKWHYRQLDPEICREFLFPITLLKLRGQFIKDDEAEEQHEPQQSFYFSFCRRAVTIKGHDLEDEVWLWGFDNDSISPVKKRIKPIQLIPLNLNRSIMKS